MSKATITREVTPTKGRYVGRVSGMVEEAELTFSRTSPTLVIADHTFVPESMRGMGVGQALVERLVADAREDGFKIIPLCPFVKAQAHRHPEWADPAAGWLVRRGRRPKLQPARRAPLRWKCRTSVAPRPALRRYRRARLQSVPQGPGARQRDLHARCRAR